MEVSCSLRSTNQNNSNAPQTRAPQASPPHAARRDRFAKPSRVRVIITPSTMPPPRHIAIGARLNTIITPTLMMRVASHCPAAGQLLIEIASAIPRFQINSIPAATEKSQQYCRDNRDPQKSASNPPPAAPNSATKQPPTAAGAASV